MCCRISFCRPFRSTSSCSFRRCETSTKYQSRRRFAVVIDEFVQHLHMDLAAILAAAGEFEAFRRRGLFERPLRMLGHALLLASGHDHRDVLARRGLRGACSRTVRGILCSHRELAVPHDRERRGARLHEHPCTRFRFFERPHAAHIRVDVVQDERHRPFIVRDGDERRDMEVRLAFRGVQAQFVVARSAGRAAASVHAQRQCCGRRGTCSA